MSSPRKDASQDSRDGDGVSLNDNHLCVILNRCSKEYSNYYNKFASLHKAKRMCSHAQKEFFESHCCCDCLPASIDGSQASPFPAAVKKEGTRKAQTCQQDGKGIIYLIYPSTSSKGHSKRDLDAYSN